MTRTFPALFESALYRLLHCLYQNSPTMLHQRPEAHPVRLRSIETRSGKRQQSLLVKQLTSAVSLDGLGLKTLVLSIDPDERLLIRAIAMASSTYEQNQQHQRRSDVTTETQDKGTLFNRPPKEGLEKIEQTTFTESINTS